MEYNFKEDLKSIREILGLTQSQIAEKIGVEQITISRNEMGKTTPSDKLLEHVYEFAFKNNIKLNRLKEMFYIENMDKNHKLLFHGAKSRIEGKLDIHKSRTNNDLGQAFIQVRDTNRRYHLFQVLKSQVCIFLILRKKV